MYYFSIGAVFKNEAHILKEWIEHYIHHGVDHIYLINDFSTDNFEPILKPYIEQKYVTLYNCEINKKYLNRQSDIYNVYFKSILHQSKWFGILDLDEFLYSPIEIDIKNVLKKYEHYNLLHVNWVHFGSSNFETQPKNVVDSFVYRGHYNSNKNGPNGRYNSYKSIVKTNGDVTLGIHSHTYNAVSNGKNVSFNEENTPLLINHYTIQSKEYWQNVKMTRGDCDYYYDTNGWKRSMQLFNELDVNDIFDDRLKKQNVNIL
jgi:hypothetical protein